jgi:GT2 family glycosyltransferase
VYHAHGATGGYGTDYTIYYGNRNIIWNSFKNFPYRLLITSLPWIVGRNLAVIPYYILKGHSRAILRSKIDAIKALPKMLAKRAQRLEDEYEISRYIQTWANIRAFPTNHMDNVK